MFGCLCAKVTWITIINERTVNDNVNKTIPLKMADPLPSQQGGSESSTVTIVSSDTQDGDIPTLRLRLKKPKNDKKVQWTTETVDNEDMNKKKSKCCCIFNKPRKFDESSSEDSDDECDHCHGHVEKKRHKKLSNSTVAINNTSNPNNDNLENPNPEHTTSNFN